MGYRLYHLVKYDVEIGNEVGENYGQDQILDLFEKIDHLYGVSVVSFYDSEQEPLRELEIDKYYFMKFLKKMNEDDFDEDELDLIDQFIKCILEDKSNTDIIRFKSF